MAERNENGTITLTTEELAELTAEAAKKAVESKGVSNAMAYAALRAIGNVTAVTETLGLPLPENNETVAYQDFINSANLIIDNFAKTTGTTLDNVSATATAAANGVSAADTKIANINTRLNNDNVDNLPQFMNDTEIRLENVENDVMGLSGWKKFLIASSGNPAGGIYKSSIGIYRNAFPIGENSWINITETVRYLDGGSVTTDYKFKASLGSVAGNIFNANQTNVIYAMNDYSLESEGTVHTAGLGFKWDGVSTTLYCMSTANVRQYFLPEFFPITGTPL